METGVQDVADWGHEGVHTEEQRAACDSLHILESGEERSTVRSKLGYFKRYIGVNGLNQIQFIFSPFARRLLS